MATLNTQKGTIIIIPIDKPTTQGDYVVSIDKDKYDSTSGVVYSVGSDITDITPGDVAIHRRSLGELFTVESEDDKNIHGKEFKMIQYKNLLGFIKKEANE
jgi:hypothetical protein